MTRSEARWKVTLIAYGSNENPAGVGVFPTGFSIDNADIKEALSRLSSAIEKALKKETGDALS